MSNMTGALEKAKARSVGARYYGIVAFILVVVAFFAYKALFSKEEDAVVMDEKKDKRDEAKPKPEKPEKREKQEKAEKVQVKEKAEEESDDDVIDLEEFFEKKEPKKK